MDSCPEAQEQVLGAERRRQERVVSDLEIESAGRALHVVVRGVWSREMFGIDNCLGRMWYEFELVVNV